MSFHDLDRVRVGPRTDPDPVSPNHHSRALLRDVRLKLEQMMAYPAVGGGVEIGDGSGEEEEED